MTWLKIEDNFYSHRKIVDPEAAEPLKGDIEGLAAIGLWTLGASWCSSHLTDGFISGRMLQDLGGMNVGTLIKRLVAVRLFDVISVGRYRYHDWEETNPTADLVHEQRAQRKEAAAKGGRRSGEVRRKQPVEANGSTTRLKRTVEPTLEASNEVPARPVPSVLRTTKGGASAAAGAGAPQPQTPQPEVIPAWELDAEGNRIDPVVAVRAKLKAMGTKTKIPSRWDRSSTLSDPISPVLRDVGKIFEQNAAKAAEQARVDTPPTKRVRSTKRKASGDVDKAQ